MVPHATLKHRRILAAGALGGEAMFATLGFIAHGLRMRGAEVTFLQCDRTLPACIAKIADHHESACTRWCHVNSAPFAAAMNLPCRWYGEFLTEAEREECDAAAARIDSAEIGKFRWRGVAVGPLVQLSVRRYFQRGDLELTDPEITPKARDYLRSALYLGHIADRALDELRIDKVVMTDGAYVDWGVIREVARLKGIPVDFFEDGLRGHSLRFYADRPGSTADPMTAWRQHRDTSLSDTENRHLDDYLTERFSSPFEVYSTSLKATPSRSPANHRIGPARAVRWAGLWDVPQRGVRRVLRLGKRRRTPSRRIGSSILSNSSSTARGHRLVIRAHPYEAWAKRPAQDRVDRLVAERFGPLPEHIHIIPPESDLPAGRIIEAMDVGLAYTSTVVIEAAVRGKPCLLAGGGDHAGAGVRPRSNRRRGLRRCAGCDLRPRRAAPGGCRARPPLRLSRVLPPQPADPHVRSTRLGCDADQRPLADRVGSRTRSGDGHHLRRHPLRRPL